VICQFIERLPCVDGCIVGDWVDCPVEKSENEYFVLSIRFPFCLFFIEQILITTDAIILNQR